MNTWSVSSEMISGGATRESDPVMASSRPLTGTKLTTATMNSAAGKSARKK